MLLPGVLYSLTVCVPGTMRWLCFTVIHVCAYIRVQTAELEEEAEEAHKALR